MAVLQREVTTGALGGRAASRQRLPLVRWTWERLRPALAALAQLYLGGRQPANWQMSMNPYHADRVFRTWR